MKYNIKGLFWLLALGLVFSIVGCVGDDYERYDFAEEAFDKEGAVVSISNVVGGFFDLTDKENTEISFDLGSKGEEVSSVDIYKSYNGGEKVLHSSQGLGTVSVSLSDAVSGLGVSVDDVDVGDDFLFTFESTTASGKFPSGTSLSVLGSCLSQLGGTYDFVSTNLVAANSATSCPTGPVTGTVTFEDQGGGVYLISDLGFGQYESSCWSDGPATSGDAKIIDICGEITSGGLDQYGLTYIWVITDVSGPDLSISWSNDYADSGKTVVTRTDGTDWPQIFTN